MSMVLFDEHPMLVNKPLAVEIGLNEAIVLQQIHYWLEMNKESGKKLWGWKILDI